MTERQYTTYRAGRPDRSPRARAIVGGILAAVVLAVVVLAVLVLDPFADGPDKRLTAFLDAWEQGDDRAAADLTDNPAEALRLMTASRKGLDGARLSADAGTIAEHDDTATADAALAWRVPEIGGWRYRVKVGLVKRDDAWVVRWLPTVVHPELDARTRLGTAVEAPRRAAILDRDGRALMADRAVTDVAVETAKVTDAADTAARIAPLVDVDAAKLERSIRDAPKGRFVPVITIRRTTFDAIAKQLTAVPGASVNQREAPLAPTKGFARALLGSVGPATAEQVEASKGRLSPTDQVGQWGLQAKFDAQLRGTPARRIVTRDLADGASLDTLLKRPGKEGRSLRTTLDRQVQAAAESALGARSDKAALVAVQPSTGDVLAVANRPTPSTFDRALEGLYPPGSTFKVVSTTALLRDGLSVDETVDCPATRTVGGRAFRNFEGGAAGAVPFRIDFAQSCNTAFVSLSKRLEGDALTATARDFGLGEEPKLPLRAATSQVPPATDPVARAAMMIVQDKIVASPLAMAGVAATVADGRWLAPRLVKGAEGRTGEPLAEAPTLRELMRAVVTSGTGTALASVPGEPSGKSGTAEYGGGDPPPTHAWFIAFRGDVAVAVLVEGGKAGGTVAAPIAAKFLTALGAAAPPAPA